MLLPAHHTKHLSLLHYPYRYSTFVLAQSDNGISNGTALWLGAQCLSSYLTVIKKPKGTAKMPRAIELGSGIGLTALALSTLGWDVVATDVPEVIYAVLKPNIISNAANLPSSSGSIQVRELDWRIPPEEWCWDSDFRKLGDSMSAEALRPPFDLIVTADTVYIPELVEPLLRTLHALSSLSVSCSVHPPVYVCLERRDPGLVNRFFEEAKNKWYFQVERIPHKGLVKALDKSGIRWNKEEWDDVEIWKMVLQSATSKKVL